MEKMRDLSQVVPHLGYVATNMPVERVEKCLSAAIAACRRWRLSMMPLHWNMFVPSGSFVAGRGRDDWISWGKLKLAIR
ncbi:hypothetical protein AMTR_s00065p00160910 [Amborella trichopoda]|uniref:Uncharacterized protein n=1 Tax=Amborella trichopoda TaxID=13333 RepID=U5D8T4_AMBTC|nr:hypothetical protein AMTR_s00065p00160910 [Amborella trichopoda]